MTPIAQLLQTARAAHAEYRRLAAHGTRGPVNANQEQRDAAIRKALEARERAHELDPLHRDGAWVVDGAQHAALLNYYRQYLGDAR